MIKKVLCLVLALSMLCGVVMLSSCGKTTTLETNERLPATISVLGITSKETTPEAVQAVEDAINEIMGATYSTHIDLTLVTADKYYDLVKERIALAEYNETRKDAIDKYNTTAISAASDLDQYSHFGKWRTKVSGVEATTIATSAEMSEVQTRLNEDGILEVVYPNAASPIDVVMVIGEDMYNDFIELGALGELKSYLSNESYTKFYQYVYPTFFRMLQALTGNIYAIPNNNLLAEYTYVIVKKDIAAKYNFDIETVSNYGDLAGFLAEVKANEDVIPMNTVPDALGVFTLFSDADVAIGTYCDPLIGFDLDEDESASYTVKNLFEIPEYVNHNTLMDTYDSAGYFTSASGSTDFAVDVIKGDASVKEIYGDEYDVKILQNPFVTKDKIFAGMLGVSTYTSDIARSLEFILELTTNPEIKNIFQYGIEGENYTVNEDGTITRLNRNYIMDTGTTGNVYMGYPEEGMLADQWKYTKITNLDSIPSPYFSYRVNSKNSNEYNMTYKITDEVIDELLKDAITRSIITAEFKRLGGSKTYDDYVKGHGTDTERALGDLIKKCNDYKEYFLDKIMENEYTKYGKTVTRAQAEALFSSTSYSKQSPRYSYDWFIERVIELKRPELFAGVYSSEELDAAVRTYIAEAAGTTAAQYSTALSDAEKYYETIEKLKIMTRIIIWDDLSDDEWAVYEQMSPSEFERAVFDHVRDSFEKENNLDAEKYEALVKAYIMKQAVIANEAGTAFIEITWEDYAEAKSKGLPFLEVIESLREQYADVLSEVGENVLKTTSAPNLPTLIHDTLYTKWLLENGYAGAGGTPQTSKFENELYNEMVAFLGITYADFSIARRAADSTVYNNYMASIKNQYKDVIIEAYSAEQFKNDTISSDDILKAILNYKKEEKTGIYASMCAKVGLTYDEYKSGLAELSRFIKYANALRTAFTYTLQTRYEKSEVDALDYADIDGIIYEIMSEEGFYINEMCIYTSTNLSSYMNEKASVKAYNKYIDAVTTALSADLAEAGYTKAQIMKMGIDEADEVLFGVVKNKYYSNAISVKQYLESISKEYLDGVKTADNRAAYVSSAAAALKTNGVFTSIVYYLNTAVSEAISDLKTKLAEQ